MKNPGLFQFIRRALARLPRTKDVTAPQRLAAQEALTRKFELLLCTATDGIHIIDHHGRLLEASDTFRRMLGYGPGEMAGLHVSNWDPGWNPQEMARQLNATRAGAILREAQHRRKDGSLLEVEIHITSASFDGHDYLCAASRDISQRKQMEQELRIAATAFEVHEGMVITDANKTILRVNQAFGEATGYQPDELVGKSLQVLRSGCHQPSFYDELQRQVLQHGYWRGEMMGRRKDGSLYPTWFTMTAVRGDDGSISHYVATETDITRQKAAEQEVNELAFYDALTRLGNRRLLMDRLQLALVASHRHGHSGALLFIDLDDFKTLNDSAGHEIGDLLLQQVAQRLLSCMREGDTVARLGGDEFVVILADLGREGTAAASLAGQIGQRILDTLNLPYELAGQVHFSSPSIGVTLFDGKEASRAELLRRADLAMYQAKAGGRNALRFFDPAMQTAISVRAELEAAMRAGLQRQEFVLHYQPQVGSDGQWVGAEALARWNHPQRGLLSSGEFITLAESSGLIIPLGQQLLRMACEQLAQWSQQIALRHLTLSLNVSARQLRQADFVEQVLAALARSGAEPGRLKLELTESLLLDNVEDTIEKMTALRKHGVGFSLDDFGTGYSSLSYLKRLPLEQLKIDQSFVRDILVDSNDSAIAQMIVALAQTMGLNVIAEGVETEPQRIFLAGCGCQTYQGYLFGRPMEAASFESLARGDGRILALARPILISSRRGPSVHAKPPLPATP